MLFLILRYKYVQLEGNSATTNLGSENQRTENVKWEAGENREFMFDYMSVLYVLSDGMIRT